MKILIIEDNETLAMGLENILKKNGYSVDAYQDGLEGKDALSVNNYDLLILDLGLPSIDGLELLKFLRKKRQKIPVLIISAKDQLEQKVLGLKLGADDYLCKPFDIQEIEARVEALLRRYFGFVNKEIYIGDIKFDTATRCIFMNKKRVQLSQRELSVFEYLVFHQNQVLSKHTLINHITTCNEIIHTTAIETYISRIRKKLNLNKYLKTIRGLGYILTNG